MQPKIICFGETLFDKLPDGALPGGAPLNVAIHLKYNGHLPLVVSRVGSDLLGKELIQFLQETGLSTDYIQRDLNFQTGIVEADISDKTQVSYTIVEPVAWDFIGYEELVARMVSDSDVFIYGSLASRSKTTRETLLKYLPLARLKVFDVNLRPPHYTPEGIGQLMAHADIIKMNHHELIEITSWYGKSLDEKESMDYLRRRFNKQLLLVTRGENGASLITKYKYFEHPGFQVTVADTIGSGDAFLATFLHHYLSGSSPEDALPNACAAGAYVATQRGATPKMPDNYLHTFLNNHLTANHTAI